MIKDDIESIIKTYFNRNNILVKHILDSYDVSVIVFSYICSIIQQSSINLKFMFLLAPTFMRG